MVKEKSLVYHIIEGIQLKKGRDIVHVDMSALEYAATPNFVICTGNTSIQVDAIADSVREHVQEQTGVKPYNYDGYQNSEWIIIDYGTVYVHVFAPDARRRYRLEDLWSDAKVIEIPNQD